MAGKTPLCRCALGAEGNLHSDLDLVLEDTPSTLQIFDRPEQVISFSFYFWGSVSVEYCRLLVNRDSLYQNENLHIQTLIQCSLHGTISRNCLFQALIPEWLFIWRDQWQILNICTITAHSFLWTLIIFQFSIQLVEAKGITDITHTRAVTALTWNGGADLRSPTPTPTPTSTHTQKNHLSFR